MIVIMMMTASYIGDDVRIVYALANTMRSFSVTDKAILGVGRMQIELEKFLPDKW